jgi:hypothetical protein
MRSALPALPRIQASPAGASTHSAGGRGRRLFWSFRIDQAAQCLFHFNPGALIGNTSDRFLRLSQTQTVLAGHGAQQTPASGLEVLEQQTARTRASHAGISAAEAGDQVVQTLKISVLWHVNLLIPRASPASPRRASCEADPLIGRGELSRGWRHALSFLKLLRSAWPQLWASCVARTLREQAWMLRLPWWSDRKPSLRAASRPHERPCCFAPQRPGDSWLPSHGSAQPLCVRLWSSKSFSRRGLRLSSTVLMHGDAQFCRREGNIHQAGRPDTRKAGYPEGRLEDE